jgi:hypothetical protein
MLINLLDKGFIRVSNSLAIALILFVKSLREVYSFILTIEDLIKL